MLDTTRPLPEPPPAREPVFKIPLGIVIALAILVAIHAVRQLIPESWDNEVLLRLSFIPGTFSYAVDPAAILENLRRLAEAGDAGLRQAQLGRYILTSIGPQPWTVFSYALLHADWGHIGLNALWLLAFGSPVARRLGTLRFCLFLTATSFAGALAHFLTHPLDLQPVIGASAAVSGCMGAALRFMFQPQRLGAEDIGVRSARTTQGHSRPLSPLIDLLRDRRVVGFLAAWLVANLLFGIGIVAIGSSDAPVAWQAHIGGLLAGLLALPMFDRRELPLPTSGPAMFDDGDSDAPDAE